MNNQFPYPTSNDLMMYPQPAAPYSQQWGPQPVEPINYAMVQYVPDYRYAQALQQNQEEIDRLRNQLERKILKEEELRQVLQMQGNAYFSMMAGGRMVQLTHFSFETVKSIMYDPLYGRKAQIWIRVSTQEEPGLIDWEDFWNDKKWISFLERISRTKITIYGSVKRVALLLRSIANEIITEAFVPYLGGWSRADGCFLYHTFHGFRTSAREGEPEQYETSLMTLPTNAKAATERFLARFALIGDGKLRSFCILWQHLSFLQTLLLEQGVHLTKIPVVQAGNPVVQAYLRSVLTVSADGVLNMNETPDDFAWALASCKDQTCVILPPKFGKNTMDNEGILDEAISSGTIALKKGMTCPLSTLPILLANGEGQVFSYGIPLAAGAEAFDLPRCAEVAAKPACPADYWSSFLAFTHLHMDELNHLLEEQMAQALIRSADCEYTMEHAAVLGAMWGVAEFLQLFARELSLSDYKILDDGWLGYTIALLEESDALYAAPGGLADSFLAAARRAICQRELPRYRIGQQLSAFQSGAVYFNEDFVCLDRAAFERICQAAGCQSGTVKQELAEQGYFTGKTVNGQSYQTRISVSCKDGESRMIRVYKFRRNCFEILGEPSTFQEV